MSSAAREDLLAAVEKLEEEDLRALMWIAGQLPFRRLASELQAEVAKGVRPLRATTREQVARASLLGALRDIGVAIGLKFPTAAELAGGAVGDPRPPHRPIDALPFDLGDKK